MSDELVTPRDHAELNYRSVGTLAHWWCVLNAWEWPEGLPNPEKRPEKARRQAIMQEISGRVGLKRCLSAWERSTYVQVEWRKTGKPSASR